MFSDLFEGPVPPLRGEQTSNVLEVEARASKSGGVSSDDLIGCDILCAYAECTNHSSVSDCDPGHNCGIASNPHIVANDGIAGLLHLTECMERVFSLPPGSAEHSERVCRRADHRLIPPQA